MSTLIRDLADRGFCLLGGLSGASLSDRPTNTGPTLSPERKTVMTDTDISSADRHADESGAPAEDKRPDQGAANSPGQSREGPASGGEGAAGAGGPDGFGTGQ